MVVIKKSEADLQNTHSVTSMAWPSTAPGGRAGLDNSLINICSCQQQFLRSKSRSHSLDGAAWAVKDEGAGAGGACHIYGQGRGTNSQRHTKTTKYNEVQFEQRRVFTILNLQLKQCCPNLFIIPATTAAFTWQVHNSKFPVFEEELLTFCPISAADDFFSESCSGSCGEGLSMWKLSHNMPMRQRGWMMLHLFFLCIPCAILRLSIAKIAEELSLWLFRLSSCAKCLCGSGGPSCLARSTQCQEVSSEALHCNQRYTPLKHLS